MKRAGPTLAVIRAIDLLERHICNNSRDYGAYQDDPIEANLHELGHVLCREGLDKALRTADAGKFYDVDIFCGSLRHADRNEYNAIAFTFRVCRAIGYGLPEDEIVREAAVSSSTIDTFDKHRGVAKSLRDPRIRRIAAQFVTLITEMT